MLINYKKNHPNFHFTLSTFGFGYNLDSVLLEDFAKLGDGMCVESML